MNVYQRLNAAREQFHTLKLSKSGHNKFAGYYYFELGDFLIPALKVFREQKLCATVSFGSELASMTIRCEDKPEDCLTITSPMGSAALKGCHEVQNIGAVETYQRRYLWVAALEIVEHDALDSTTGKDSKAERSGKPLDGAEDLVSPERLSELETLALDMIDAHRNDRTSAAVDAYYTVTDNESKVCLWKLLGAESKLRATIKANKPKETA